ncbi:jacalin-like lectin [Thalassolituus sp. LLYu03]|uniref:jacalin-like lectin n=1 Tax=Thalassolituus sp. LLYu03 TaxID=3421656 RepID=UPI003D2A88F1
MQALNVKRPWGVMGFCALALAFNAQADSGQFSTLTYNVAGLLEVFSSAESDRQSATEQISCYVNEFDFVNVQEDFNYHAALYDTCDDHPYRSATTGGMGIGSGLNTMSRFEYQDWERVSWDDCNGVDCLTPKGFTLARTRLAEGVYVDIYNLHTQAQTEDADLSARRANLLQLADFIEENSAGNAVIVMGDTNTRYTRDGDNMWELLNRGFSDAWLNLVRNGDVPASGADALVCDPKITSADCEIVDKIVYRSNGFITLNASLYEVRQDDETSDGLKLSDHPPVQTNFSWSTRADRQLSDPFGGPHGTAFNDVSLLPDNPATKTVSLRAGSRVDQLGITLSNGFVSTHGGSGGTAKSLTLNSGEYLASLNVCSGKKDDHTRIFYAKFTTTSGRTLSGGSTTSSCTTFTAPSGWQIVGFHGRAGDELDKVGVIYAPQQSGDSAVSWAALQNQASGLCLDINGGTMADGTNVLQWTCSGATWQQWHYDASTGLVRSKNDPRFCLDNSNVFGNGANIQLHTCNGSAAQQFVLGADGALAMRTLTSQVVDGYGTSAGDNVGTWWNWGGGNQRWTQVP